LGVEWRGVKNVRFFQRKIGHISETLRDTCTTLLARGYVHYWKSRRRKGYY